MLQQFNPKNRALIVNINGQLVHRDKAGISPFDSAVQGGDAVWEGLRLYGGRIFKLYEHLGRLERSARALSFAEIPPREKIVEEIKRTLAANKMRDSVTSSHAHPLRRSHVRQDPRLNAGQLIVLADPSSLFTNWSDLIRQIRDRTGYSRRHESITRICSTRFWRDRSKQRRRRRCAHAQLGVSSRKQRNPCIIGRTAIRDEPRRGCPEELPARRSGIAQPEKSAASKDCQLSSLRR